MKTEKIFFDTTMSAVLGKLLKNITMLTIIKVTLIIVIFVYLRKPDLRFIINILVLKFYICLLLSEKVELKLAIILLTKLFHNSIYHNLII